MAGLMLPQGFKIRSLGGSSSISDRLLTLSNMITLYPMNETSGSSLADVVGGRNATPTSLTLGGAMGPDGQPVPIFDGLNSYVTVPNTVLPLIDETEFTIGAFFRLTTAAAASATVFRIETTPVTILRTIYPAARVEVLTKLSAVQNLATLNWSVIWLTASQSGNYISGYLNTTLLGTTTWSSFNYASATYRMGSTVSGTELFAGNIANHFVRNAPTTVAEMQNIIAGYIS